MSSCTRSSGCNPWRPLPRSISATSLLQHPYAVVDRTHNLTKVAIVTGSPHGVNGVTMRAYALRVPHEASEQDVLDDVYPVRVV